MQSFRAYILYGSLFCLLSHPCLASADQTDMPVLEWCLDHFPPRHSYLPGQQPTGPLVEMMQKLAEHSGFTLRYSPPTPTVRCLKLMQQGKTDLMTSLLWSEEREQYMLLLPFDEARPETLFVHKDRQFADETALQNLQIALIKTRTYSKGFLELLAKHQLKVRQTDDIEQAMAMLHFQQVDIVAGPLHLSEHLLELNPRLHASIMINPWQTPVRREMQTHLALSRMSPNFHLHLHISQQLEKMVQAKQTHFYQ